ncbi:MAG: hypothetical protein GY898_01765 [Proteobacteria bacterium]|nr:hypothetical protein [Pseudomonadota bacterium]
MKPFVPIATALLLLWACGPDQEPDPSDDDDIYEVPDDDDLFDPVSGEEGWPCPEGPAICNYDLGCNGDVCTACTDADQCRGLQGCRDDGSCGACTVDAECASGESCRSGFCMPTDVPEWHLEIAASDLELMNTDVYARLEVPATLRVGDVTYAGPATARFLGSSTLAFPKKSFRVEFPEDADHPGFARKINLRAEYNDGSFLRTYLGYETMRRAAGVPAPRARYVNLTLNGDNYGLMLEVERIGGKFLRKNGRDRDLPMYEGKETTPWGALMPMDDEAQYREYYSKATGDDADWSDLISLVEDTFWEDHLESEPWGPTTAVRTRELVDTDAYVSYLATLAAIQSQDHITNNYYFSWQEVPGVGFRWEFYPWDMDLTFGCLWNEETNTSPCGDTVSDDWWLNGVVVPPIVAGQPNECWCNLPAHLVMNDPELGRDYRDRMCSIIGSEWWNERLPDLAAAVAETIATRVEADTADRNETPQEWADRRQEVLNFLVDRKAHLQGELECP